MNLRRVLTALVRVVADEARHNPEFAMQIEAALTSAEATHAAGKSRSAAGQPRTEPKRGAHRRAAPVLDPISLARQGEKLLRQELGKLNLEQLLDVVAGYGMDTGKLVMKWKTPERVADRIVEVATSRAQKKEVPFGLPSQTRPTRINALSPRLRRNGSSFPACFCK